MGQNKLPFIARFTEKQKDTPQYLQTYYDEQKKVTMVRTEHVATPLVRYQNPISELLTKTEAARESDDYNLSSLELEFLTKTAEAREFDETNLSDLELRTKTFEERETDDYNTDIVFSEMYTKTKQLREGEDMNDEVDLL